MAGFSVDPQALYQYGGQFREAGAIWSGGAPPPYSGTGVTTILQGCNLPQDAFGSDPPAWTLVLHPFWSGQAQPQLYQAYDTLWQFVSGVAGSAQSILDGWADNLDVVGNAYYIQDHKQAASMHKTGVGLQTLP
jgi:hypothetical protein